MVHKFPRMTVEQVLQKWEKEHHVMVVKEKFSKETSTKGLEVVFRFENLSVVKLKPDHQELSLEMARESALMQHCLGEFDNDRDWILLLSSIFIEAKDMDMGLKKAEHDLLEIYPKGILNNLLHDNNIISP